LCAHRLGLQFEVAQGRGGKNGSKAHPRGVFPDRWRPHCGGGPVGRLVGPVKSTQSWPTTWPPWASCRRVAAATHHSPTHHSPLTTQQMRHTTATHPFAMNRRRRHELTWLPTIVTTSISDCVYATAIDGQLMASAVRQAITQSPSAAGDVLPGGAGEPLDGERSSAEVFRLGHVGDQAPPARQTWHSTFTGQAAATPPRRGRRPPPLSLVRSPSGAANLNASFAQAA
jgi:hypothetical protein